MSSQNPPGDPFYLSGETMDRFRQALTIARYQARIAQNGGYGRHTEDVLVEVEAEMAAYLTRIRGALDHDKAEAEESGEAERERQSWFPSYRAA
jgi:hypothetical protein